MKKFFITVLFILMSVLAVAQSQTLLTAARAELSKRGLNEMDVRVRLLQEGINVDSIPPSEYAQYQDRVISILNQMQAEKSGNAPVTTGTPNGQVNASMEVVNSDGVVVNPIVAPTVSPADAVQTTIGEASAEAALEQTLKDNHVSPTAGNAIYGHGFFTGKTMDVFRTTDGAQAPDTYILGVGDEIHVSIFGSSQTEIHQRISPDGSIQPTGSTKIFLKGLTLEQGRELIRSKLASHYSFRPDQIAVTISTARTLNVNIYGEVGVQGGFTVSALNTVFNALSAAGGPTALGSVRNIQLSRAGKTQRMDLYQFMSNPTDGSYYDLRNNDVIFVPVAQKIVSIQGAVHRPMSYELVEGETLVDLIRFAGGITDTAYPDYMQIERLDKNGPELLEYSLSKVMSGAQKVSLMPGDIVRVMNSDLPMEKYVAVGGDVYYPGRYNLGNNRSLKALLENVKPRYTARTDYLFVERRKPDETVDVLTVPFPGFNGSPDFILEARDSVAILNLASYRDVEAISVNGQVRRPFSRDFGLNDHMTVAQAIEYAGGLKPSVFPVAYIFRKDVTNPAKMEYIPISLETDGDTLLRPGDHLNVYDNSTYTNMGEVAISGAINTPSRFAFSPNLTVHDLITMAGGLEIGADYDRVEVFRVDISKHDEAHYKVLILNIDDDFNPKDPNFQLQPFDHLVVRLTPEFHQGRVVEVNGRVKYPGVYLLPDSATQLSEIIKLAGGLRDDASEYCTLFRTYKNRGSIGINLKEMERHKKNTRYDPYLMSEDVINIVRKENTVTIQETGTRMAQFTPEEYSSVKKTFVYQGRHSAKWYIRHHAGGFHQLADRNSVTVTSPNNQTEGTKRFLGFRIYPTVQPGSVITMSMSQKKMEKKDAQREKVKWEQVAASTFSTLTSVVSMILLIERLN